MANSRAQRKANRAKLKAELWKSFNEIAQDNKFKNPKETWKLFIKSIDMFRFKSDPMYRQEILALKREFEGIVNNALKEAIYNNTFC